MTFQHYLYILGGVPYTLCIGLLAIIIGFICGFVMGSYRAFSHNMIVHVFKTYSLIIRFTPITVQIFLALLLPFQNIYIAIGVLGLNSSAYFSEIIYSGFQQLKAIYEPTVQSINITSYQAYKSIYSPLVFKSQATLLKTEMVNIFKETSIIAMIGISEIALRARTAGAYDLKFLLPMVLAGLLYFILNIIHDLWLSPLLFCFMKYLI